MRGKKEVNVPGPISSSVQREGLQPLKGLAACSLLPPSGVCALEGLPAPRMLSPSSVLVAGSMSLFEVFIVFGGFLSCARVNLEMGKVGAVI